MDCIHYVDFPELVRLEKEREGISINFKAKLVGNDHDNVANGMQVSTSNASGLHRLVVTTAVVPI